MSKVFSIFEQFYGKYAILLIIHQPRTLVGPLMILCLLFYLDSLGGGCSAVTAKFYFLYQISEIREKKEINIRFSFSLNFVSESCGYWLSSDVVSPNIYGTYLLEMILLMMKMMILFPIDLVIVIVHCTISSC